MFTAELPNCPIYEKYKNAWESYFTIFTEISGIALSHPGIFLSCLRDWVNMCCSLSSGGSEGNGCHGTDRHGNLPGRFVASVCGSGHGGPCSCSVVLGRTHSYFPHTVALALSAGSLPTCNKKLWVQLQAHQMQDLFKTFLGQILHKYKTFSMTN